MRIFQISPIRTGTTLIWNILRKIFSQIEVYKANQLDDYVRKSLDEDSNIKVVSTIRDPRDTLCSYMTIWYELWDENKICAECGGELIVRPSYLKKRGKYPPKPKPKERSKYWREEVEEVEEEIEEVEEKPSYLKKRDREPQQPKERTMQEAAAEISSEYRKERLSSYETEDSSKKENLVKTEKKKWYKSGVFIACMIFLFIPIFNEIYRCGGICPTLGTKGLTTIISTPIIVVLIPVGIFRLIRKLIKSIK